MASGVGSGPEAAKVTAHARSAIPVTGGRPGLALGEGDVIVRPAMASRTSLGFKTRLLAMLCIISVLSGMGLDVHAMLMGHGPQSTEPAVVHDHAGDQHLVGQYVDGDCDRHADDRFPGGPVQSGCCHAAMCVTGAVVLSAGLDHAGLRARDVTSSAIDLTLLGGLHHAPPLRPPR